MADVGKPLPAAMIRGGDCRAWPFGQQKNPTAARLGMAYLPGALTATRCYSMDIGDSLKNWLMRAKMVHETVTRSIRSLLRSVRGAVTWFVVPGAVVALALVPGCSSRGFFTSDDPGGNQITGSGRLVTRSYDVCDFTGVDVGHAFIVDIRQSETYSVAIIVDDNLADYIRVVKQGQLLKIGFAGDHSYNYKSPRLTIGMPRLSHLSLSGATNVTASGFKSFNNLRINLSGASSLRGRIDSGDTTITASGASLVSLDGVGTRLTIDGSGASQAKLGNYVVTDASVTVSGGGRAEVNVVGKLDVHLTGGSHLSYSGSPTLGQVSTSGGSSLTRQQ